MAPFPWRSEAGCSAPLILKVVQKVAARLLQAEQRRKQKQQKVENPQKKVPAMIRDPPSHVPREPSADPSSGSRPGTSALSQPSDPPIRERSVFLSSKTSNPHLTSLFTPIRTYSFSFFFVKHVLQEFHASESFPFEYVADESKNRIRV